MIHAPRFQDLLSVTLEIPFSVPPYMSLLARSVATLEGIALAGDPEYQMVAQVSQTATIEGEGDRVACITQCIPQCRYLCPLTMSSQSHRRIHLW